MLRELSFLIESVPHRFHLMFYYLIIISGSFFIMGVYEFIKILFAGRRKRGKWSIILLFLILTGAVVSVVLLIE